MGRTDTVADDPSVADYRATSPRWRSGRKMIMDGSYTIFPSILYLPRRSSISRTQTSGSYFTWRSI